MGKQAGGSRARRLSTYLLFLGLLSAGLVGGAYLLDDRTEREDLEGNLPVMDAAPASIHELEYGPLDRPLGAAPADIRRPATSPELMHQDSDTSVVDPVVPSSRNIPDLDRDSDDGLPQREVDRDASPEGDVGPPARWQLREPDEEHLGAEEEEPETSPPQSFDADRDLDDDFDPDLDRNFDQDPQTAQVSADPPFEGSPDGSPWEEEDWEPDDEELRAWMEQEGLDPDLADNRPLDEILEEEELEAFLEDQYGEFPPAAPPFEEEVFFEDEELAWQEESGQRAQESFQDFQAELDRLERSPEEIQQPGVPNGTATEGFNGIAQGEAQNERNDVGDLQGTPQGGDDLRAGVESGFGGALMEALTTMYWLSSELAIPPSQADERRREIGGQIEPDVPDPTPGEIAPDAPASDADVPEEPTRSVWLQTSDWLREIQEERFPELASAVDEVEFAAIAIEDASEEERPDALFTFFEALENALDQMVDVSWDDIPTL